MERRFDLTKTFAYIIIAVIIVSGLATFWIAKDLTRYNTKCKELGGIPVHGQGIDLCLKPDVLIGEENG